MLKVDVIKSGMFSTIQDGGRKGFAFYGIPTSGFMDREAAHIANILVGNKKNSTLLEMSHLGGIFTFSENCTAAITGADMQASLNNVACKMYQTQVVKKGDKLQFKNTRLGVRTYLAIQGKWQISKKYNSSSTYTYGKLGGLEGRALRAKDVILIKNVKASKNTPFVRWPRVADYKEIKTIPISKGPEFSFLKNSKQLFTSFTINPQSDRMGAILDGPILNIQLQEAFKSKFLLPGMIQCTPSGKLIVVLQDGQTTGGYPRVGMISKKVLNRFNQLQPGIAFKFIKG